MIRFGEDAETQSETNWAYGKIDFWNVVAFISTDFNRGGNRPQGAGNSASNRKPPDLSVGRFTAYFAQQLDKAIPAAVVAAKPVAVDLVPVEK